MASKRKKDRVLKLLRQFTAWVEKQDDDDVLAEAEMYLDDAFDLLGDEGLGDPREC